MAHTVPQLLLSAESTAAAPSITAGPSSPGGEHGGTGQESVARSPPQNTASLQPRCSVLLLQVT